MATSIIPHTYKYHIASQFVESLTEQSNTAYYVFASRHVPFANGVIPDLYDNTDSLVTNTYANMLFGKRVANNDVAYLIRRVNYTSNTIYDMYDDRDTDLGSKDFYVVVDEGATFHVWKVLDNNDGDYSTVQPTYSDISVDDDVVYETSDHYRWKYMYSANADLVAKFATSEFFPCYTNANVAANTVDGAIEAFKLNDPGFGYSNYLLGTFSSSDIRLNGNAVTFALSNSASTTNTFYNNCVIYISSGTGVGQFRTITDYVVNATTKYVILDEQFDTDPTNASQYQIYPKILVDGGGTQTVNATGRAIINSTGNTVWRTELLESGAGYEYANAQVLVSPIINVTLEANVRAIHGPAGGHGYSAQKELYATSVGIVTKFSNSESNTIPTLNDINQIGLMRDPNFANVVLTVNTVTGTFVTGETVYEVSPVLLQGTVSVNTTSANLVGTTTDFTSQFAVGDWIYLKSSSSNQLAIVNAIANGTSMTIIGNSIWTCTAANVYMPRPSAYGTVASYTTGVITFSTVTGVVENATLLIGDSSGAIATINVISRNDVVKGFDTFINMYKYKVTINSGTFTGSEQVFQDNVATKNAYFHSVESLGGGNYHLYTTQQINQFDNSSPIIGLSSGASANVITQYDPELEYNSGEVIYLENIDTVTRSTNQTETFKLIFEF